MCCSSPTPPAAPDPYATANAQAQANKDTAQANAALNRVNQYTPWGSSVYSQNGVDSQGNPLWNQTVNLSPDQQKLLDSSNRISQSMANLGESQLGNVANSLNTPFNYNGAPSQVSNVQQNPLMLLAQGSPLQNKASYGSIQNDVDMSGVPKLIGGDDLVKDLQTQRDALYNQQKAFLDPQWQQDQHDLENKLVQQGVMQNSDAWNRSMDDLMRNREFAYNNARNSAITGGGNEQSRLFNIGLASNQNAYNQALNNAQFHNASQQQGFGQSLANAGLNNAAAGQTFSQNLQNSDLYNRAQGQQFNQGVTNANLQNQARSQFINEQNYLRQQPLNELNALRTGSQVTAPQFQGLPQVNQQGVDLAGLINNNYNQQLGVYNAQMGQRNGMMGGLFQLGAAALPFML